MRVCDRCRINLKNVEEFAVDSWDENGASCEGKDQIRVTICRKCFDDPKRWFRGWLTGGVLQWDQKHKQSRGRKA